MKIKAKSWHYRLYCFLWERTDTGCEVQAPKNLCEYTRFFVIKSLVLISMWLVIAPLATCVLWTGFVLNTILQLIWRTILFRTACPYKFIVLQKSFWPVVDGNLQANLFHYRPITKYPGFGAFVPAVLWFAIWLFGASKQTKDISMYVVMVFCCLFVVVVVGAWCYSAYRKADTSNLLAAYFKAKKEKVCPLIEVIDDNGQPHTET